MVSLWSWRGDDSSPASFEKKLSTLSSNTTKATTNLELCRQRARRFKGLWTLYSSFAYLLYLLIVVLVIGWKSCGAVEYTSLAGGPLIIYLVRLSLSSYYDYRISNIQAYIDAQQKQRESTIDKLKAATKYNTTQQLLEKYGGASPKPKSGNHASDVKPSPSSTKKENFRLGSRTSFVPPPTAIMPGRQNPASVPSTPQRSTALMSPTGTMPPPLTAGASSVPWQQRSSLPAMDSTADFAPNAFPEAAQYAPMSDGARWYDRIMDVLLGEDEAHPKNRLALICGKCRLVNGQAPPGVKTLEAVGRWRCASCGTMNGEESEATRLVAALQAQERRPNTATSAKSEGDEVILVGRGEGTESEKEEDVLETVEAGTDAGMEGEEESAEEEVEVEVVVPEPKPKRGRPKGSKKVQAS